MHRCSHYDDSPCKTSQLSASNRVLCRIRHLSLPPSSVPAAPSSRHSSSRQNSCKIGAILTKPGLSYLVYLLTKSAVARAHWGMPSSGAYGLGPSLTAWRQCCQQTALLSS